MREKPLILRGLDWLRRIDSEWYHKRLLKMRGTRLRNAIVWRMTEWKFGKKYGERKQ